MTASTFDSSGAGRERRRRLSAEFARRLFQDPKSKIGIVLLAAILLAVAVGPLLWPLDPELQDLSLRIAPPSPAHPLGTDSVGRDVLARVLVGGRVSLAVTFASVAASTLIGGAIGLISGYFGGVVDSVLMRINDVLLALPFLLLALMVSVALGPGLLNTVIALTIPAIPRDARLVRSAVLTVRQSDYIAAARATGVRPAVMLTRYVLKNITSLVLVVMSVGFAYTLLAVSGLGFLGLGVQPPAPEWGAMLSDGRSFIVSNPVVVIVPGVAILLTALAANLVGDALRDAFDTTR